MKPLLCGAMAASLALTGAAAGAQVYPAKPVRLIVPFPPGSGVDIVARMIGTGLGEAMENPVVIDNRPGGSGTIGTGIAARANPDGHTLLMATGGLLTVVPFMRKDLPYSTKRDFAPITLAAATPNMLVVPLSLPARSVAELIALARSKPGALNYASTGIGTGSHLATELFKMKAGIDLVNVPYQGSGQALIDLIRARVDLFFSNALGAIPHVKSGKLRALGVTSPVRLPIAPDVPTIAESGLPGFATETSYGMLAPAGTSRAIVGRLNAEIVRVVRSPSSEGRLAEAGARAIGDTPAQFAAHIDSELATWGKVVAAAGLSAK